MPDNAAHPLHRDLLMIIRGHLNSFPFTKADDQIKFEEQCLQLAFVQWLQKPANQALTVGMASQLTIPRLIEVLEQNELAQTEFRKILESATQAVMVTYLVQQVTDLKDEIELSEDKNELHSLRQQLIKIYRWEQQHLSAVSQ